MATVPSGRITPHLPPCFIAANTPCSRTSSFLKVVPLPDFKDLGALR